MQKFTVQKLATAGVVGAAYAALALFGSIFGVTYGPIQCRFSEALTVLPFFLPEAVPGLFVGCLVTNLMSTVGPLDIILGEDAEQMAGTPATGHLQRCDHRRYDCVVRGGLRARLWRCLCL